MNMLKRAFAVATIELVTSGFHEALTVIAACGTPPQDVAVVGHHGHVGED